LQTYIASGKFPGSKQIKKSFDDKTAQIAAELTKQIKEQENLNWIQKEYFCQYINLPHKQREILIETLLENQRRGNFVRIYPTKNSDYYDCFFSQNRANQQMLYYYLYSEVFPSFKDYIKPSSLFSSDHILKALQQAHNPCTSNPAADNRRITREILLEYLQRVLKLWKSIPSQSGDKVIEECRCKTLILVEQEILETRDDLKPSEDRDEMTQLIKRQSSASAQRDVVAILTNKLTKLKAEVREQINGKS